MKQREERKQPHSGKKYVRRISLESLYAKEATESSRRRSGRPQEKCEQSGRRNPQLRLTVRGLRHGRVCMEAEDGTEYTASRDGAHGTLWGDAVLAELCGHERVHVVKVLERAHETIVGVLREKHGVRFIIPLERRLPQGIAVRPGGEAAKDGDIVHTRVIRWEDEGGLLVRIDGRIGSFSQTSCALDALIAASRLRTAFAPDVIAEASAADGEWLYNYGEEVKLEFGADFFDGRNSDGGGEGGVIFNQDFGAFEADGVVDAVAVNGNGDDGGVDKAELGVGIVGL